MERIILKVCTAHYISTVRPSLQPNDCLAVGQEGEDIKVICRVQGIRLRQPHFKPEQQEVIAVIDSTTDRFPGLGMCPCCAAPSPSLDGGQILTSVARAIRRDTTGISTIIGLSAGSCNPDPAIDWYGQCGPLLTDIDLTDALFDGTPIEEIVRRFCLWKPFPLEDH